MNGFFYCSTAAVRMNLAPSVSLVYCHLARSSNSQRSSYWSKNGIARACGISAATVVRATRALKTAGLLKVKARFQDRRQTSNLYTLLDTSAAEHDCGQIHMKSLNDSNESPQENVGLFPCRADVFETDLSPLEVKIYIYLSMRANEAKQCTPTRKAIAKDCGVSVSSVSRAIGHLTALGFLSVQPQTRKQRLGSNGQSSNLYALKEARRKLTWLVKSLFAAFLCACVTPSPSSPVTPQEANSLRKVTVKQRKEKTAFLFTKWKIMQSFHFPARLRFMPAKSFAFVRPLRRLLMRQDE